MRAALQNRSDRAFGNIRIIGDAPYQPRGQTPL